MTDEVRVVTIVEGRPVVQVMGVGATAMSDLPLSGTGVVVRTGLGTYVARTLASVAAALTITNPDGVAAAPTFSLSAELQAVAALGTTGYVQRTGAATWSASASVPYSDLSGVPSTFAPSAHTHPWADITGTPTTLGGYGITDAAAAVHTHTWAQITGTPTTATGYGIVSIDSVPIGATTASTGRFSTFTATGAGTLPGAGGWTPTGEHGVRVNAATDRSMQIGLPSSVNSTLYGTFTDMTAPATVTSALYGHHVRLGSAATAFTVGNLVHYAAFNATLGAGSTITAVKGFWAFNAIAVGASNYGFYSDINNATNTWQLYMAGTAASYINGQLSIATAVTATDVILRIAQGITHAGTATTLYGTYSSVTVPATATSSLTLYNGIGGTVAAAFTLSNLQYFVANTATVGAGSTITNVRGFYAQNAIAVGSNNYGFYSDINDANTTYQFFGQGSASSVLNGPLNFLTPTTGKDVLLRIGSSSSTHPSTSTTTYVAYMDITVAATSTTQYTGLNTLLRTAAAAFTIGSIHHFRAQTTSLGAGSAVTAVYGFVAENTIAVGGTNYGFYSNIAAAANTWQFYGSGTAVSFLGGALQFLSTASNNNDVIVRVGSSSAHPSTAVSVYGINISLAAPATATTDFFSVRTVPATVAAAFTVTNLYHYAAISTTKGAGSTITSMFGFYAGNAIAVGTNNYGFYSTIASATNTWQLYMSGTGANYFGGPIGILTTAPGDGLVTINGGNHPSTNTSAYVYYVNISAAASATTEFTTYRSILNSPAVASTYTAITHFFAATTAKGAGSSITNVRGFYASNNIATGTNNYGFYSDINTATTTYQLYMSGSAMSYIGGELGVRRLPTNDRALYINEPTSTGTVRIGVHSQIIGAATTTGFLQAYQSDLTTAAAAFTVGNAYHYLANSTTLGGGSAITNVIGFYAANGIAVGTNNYGFYSTINAAATTWAFYAAGTAASFFGGTAQHDKAIIEKEVALTYSASMTIDASTGNEQIITATTATAFTINAPTNPATGQYLEVTIRNASGGALGVATWNAAFKMTAWTQPANTFSRTIIFRYNGTNWVEKGRTAADVPN